MEDTTWKLLQAVAVKVSALGGIALPSLESVSAGFPSPAEDYEQKRISLDDLIIKNPSSTYLVKVEGDSMIGAGIYDEDVLVVDCSLSPKHNDVVVAIYENEYLVKRLILEAKNKGYLYAENPKYAPITLDEHSDIRIWGIVIRVIHTPYALK